MRILGVIPSRYASTRFEGKPLKEIEGHTMIEWVYKRSEKANINSLVVATDDDRIFETVKKDVLQTISEEGKSILQEAIKDLPFFVSIAIEAAVRKNK